MRRAAAALLALATLTAATRDDPLAGYAPTGPAQRCIGTSVSGSSGLRIAGDGLIVYNEVGRRLWVTRPATTCTRMRWDDTLVVEQWWSQVCRGDRFRVLNRGMSIPSAVCIFGDFTPYDRVRARTG